MKKIMNLIFKKKRKNCNHLDNTKKKMAVGIKKVDSQEQRSENFQSSKVNINNFEAIKILGSGAFGKVILAKKSNFKKLYAIKELNKAHLHIKNQIQNTFNEQIILSNISEKKKKGELLPYLAKMYYSFQSEKYLYMVLEYLPGGYFITLSFWSFS